MDKKTNKRYYNSEIFFERACKVIPGGVQTLAKGLSQSPLGVSPFYADRAKGAKIWDIDGNVYVDFVSALMAIILGYSDPDVNAAISSQLNSGTIFSLNHQLEVELSEKICSFIPSAEKIRFGKNGSDSTTAAVRLARGITGREQILVCGYHSWHDWYMSSASDSFGVPSSLSQLTHAFAFNDEQGYLDLFEQKKKDLAAVIIDPVQIVGPKAGFLELIRETTKENNTLLIFDETITAFRYALGSVQGFLGVHADLVVLGKGLSNGMPLSALLGPAKYMDHMEKMFYSFTYGGETLSMAGALATLTKIENEPVLSTIEKTGSYLLKNLKALILEYEMQDHFELVGYPVRTHFKIKEHGKLSISEKKRYFSQIMFSNGIINNTIHTINYSHTTEHVDQLLHAYKMFFVGLQRNYKV